MFEQFAWSAKKKSNADAEHVTMRRLEVARKLTKHTQKKNTNAVDEPNQILSCEINEAIKASSSQSLLNQDWSAERTTYRSALQPRLYQAGHHLQAWVIKVPQ